MTKHSYLLYLLVVCLAFVFATATLATESEYRSTTRIEKFVVLGMSCDACAKTATQALRKLSGVNNVEVDFDTKQATVSADSSLTREAIRETLGSIGFEAQFPDDPSRAKPLTDIEREKLDIAIVTHGEAFQVKDYLSKGKFTVFDFYAEWCGPCHLLTPKLERLVLQNKNVALRKVDIVSWKSDAAKQATKEYEMPGLPYVRVYGPSGDFIGAVTGNHYDKIKKLITSLTPSTEAN